MCISMLLQRFLYKNKFLKIFIFKATHDIPVGKRFSIKQLLSKLTLLRKHIAHTQTNDVRRTSKVKSQKTTKLLPEVVNVQKDE